MIIEDKHTRESFIPKFPVTLVRISITPAKEIKNLGVTFDTENTFDNHIGKVCLFRTCEVSVNSYLWKMHFFWRMLWSAVD